MSRARSAPLRIALVAPPLLPVPPRAYAGTERVIAVLADELTRRGHAVTLFASGDSSVPCELVPTAERALWARTQPSRADTAFDDADVLYFSITANRVWQQHQRFDVIHSHLEGHGFLLARFCPTPVVSTMHGRLDAPGLPELLRDFADVPLVSVSDNQRRWFPGANWVATVHHGMPLDAIPFGPHPGSYLALVGRIAPEKGVAEAVELARATGLPLRVAARMRLPGERQLFDDVLAPAIRDGVAEYLGEVSAADRDALYAGALATLMLGAWPEPFGLVAIESMGAGTPVIARRAGALPEIIEHGADGYIVDDMREARLAVSMVEGLDRRAIRERALRRFAPERMVDAYERVYRQVAARDVGRRRNVCGDTSVHPRTRASRGTLITPGPRTRYWAHTTRATAGGGHGAERIGRRRGGSAVGPSGMADPTGAAAPVSNDGDGTSADEIEGL